MNKLNETNKKITHKVINVNTDKIVDTGTFEECFEFVDDNNFHGTYKVIPLNIKELKFFNNE